MKIILGGFSLKRFIFFLLVAFSFCSILAISSSYAEGDKEHRVYPLPANVIGKYIKGTKGQKRVVMIYASWCPYCKEKFPHMIDMERVRPGSVIAISVDEDHAAFARFVRKYKDIPFKSIVHDGSKQQLVGVMKLFGGRAWDGVPSFYLIDEQNRVVKEGNFYPQQIAEFLFAE